jgi:hypothetical protein
MRFVPVKSAEQLALQAIHRAGGFGQNDVAPPTSLAWQAPEEAGR